MNYRPDIDGLRCIAVSLVILFHLGSPIAPGGFVGVDVFFVISGYIITRSILGDLEKKKFSLLSFYQKRILRILPPLFVVSAISCALGFLIMLPSDYKSLSASVVFNSFFASNILFFSETGYFDASSYTKPLLHTWSLAVEEQFYIAFPLMVLLAGYARRRLFFLIYIILGASFCISALTTPHFPSAAYFLLPWRAWEIALGAALAVTSLPTIRNRLALNALGIAAALTIVASAYFFQKSMAFPGYIAAIPCLASAVIIYVGGCRDNYFSSAIGSASMQFVGRLSYSLYLWHWPIIVFFVYWKLELPNVIESVALVIGTFALSYLSWRFIETPSRRIIHSTRISVLKFGGTLAAVSAISGLLIFAFEGFPARLASEATLASAAKNDRDPRFNECVREINAAEAWSMPCIYGAASGDQPTVALWGDSHAGSWAPALDKSAAAQNVGVAIFSRPGCPPLTDFEVYGRGREAECALYFDAVLDYLESAQSVHTVVLAMRPAQYMHGWLKYGFGERGRKDFIVGNRHAPVTGEKDKAALFETGVEETVRTLNALNKRVVVIYPVPEAGNAVPYTMARFILRGEDPEKYALEMSEFTRRNGVAISIFDRLADEGLIAPVRVNDILCRGSECSFAYEKAPLYRDTSHLTLSAARSLSYLLDAYVIPPADD